MIYFAGLKCEELRPPNNEVVMANKKGVLSLDYYEGRKTKRSLKYRLFRRTKEVLESIKVYKGDKIDSLLDIGTADAMMLDMLDKNLNIKTAVGLDFSIELLSENTNPKLNLVQGDATELPLEDDSFDVMIATAVIEHVPNAGKMLEECYRVLKENGICILTTPDPFFEHIATKIGYLKKEPHSETFRLSDLVSLLKSKGFEILRTERFMMSPVGFPYEIRIETIMKVVGFGSLLLNQLVVAQK